MKIKWLRRRRRSRTRKFDFFSHNGKNYRENINRLHAGSFTSYSENVSVQQACIHTYPSIIIIITSEIVVVDVLSNTAGYQTSNESSENEHEEEEEEIQLLFINLFHLILFVAFLSLLFFLF